LAQPRRDVGHAGRRHGQEELLLKRGVRLRSLESGGEVRDVPGPHPRRPLQAGGVERGQARQRRRGPAPIRQHRRTGQRSRPTPGPARHHELVHPQRVQDGLDVGDVIDDAGSLKRERSRRGAAVPGPRPRHQPQVKLRRQVVEPRIVDRRRRRARDPQPGIAARVPRRENLELPAVGRRHRAQFACHAVHRGLPGGQARSPPGPLFMKPDRVTDEPEAEGAGTGWRRLATRVGGSTSGNGGSNGGRALL
jgi:hypothetical protein